MAIFPGSAIPSAISAYDIDNSVRFSEGSSGGKLTRVQGTPTGNKAFTYSFWFKGKSDMAGLNDNMNFTFLDSDAGSNDFIGLGRLNGKFEFALAGGGGDGADSGQAGNAGTTNTGGGGGASGTAPKSGGNGGSGIVIIEYKFQIL